MRRSHLLTVATLLLAAVLPLAATAAGPEGTAAPNPACVSVTPSSGAEAAGCALTGAQSPVGPGAFEPTIHATPDGAIYFSTNPGSGVAVGFGAGISRSTDAGATWTDVSPKLAGRNIPLETNDPYIYADPDTGRVFTFHMAPILTCASLSFSDDKGATWTTNPVGCGPTGAWDHQTMVASKPRGLPTRGYPNVLTQCVNAIYAEMCSRSLDGGLTWSPSTPVHHNDQTSGAGTQTGHLAAAPDGTIYLPTSIGGSRPAVYVSKDSGLTWTKRVLAEMDVPFDDPTVAVDHLNNAYVAFPTNDGSLRLSISQDGGATFSAPIVVTPSNVTALKPAITVGDPGKIAIAYPGTTGIPGRWSGLAGMSETDKKKVRWGGWFTTSTNVLDASPTFDTVEATGTDPLIRGASGCVKGDRCAYIVDFIGATVTPDGIPFASFSDGCTSTSCKNSSTAANNETGATGKAVAVTLASGGDLCETRCGRFAPAAVPPAASTSMMLAPRQTGPTFSDAPEFLATWRRGLADRKAWASGRPIR